MDCCRNRLFREKKNSYMVNWSRIHESRRFSGATPALALCSFLYGLGVRLRLIAYRRKKRRSLPGFVVSIGNLTVGGTGKTPAACMMAEWALSAGYRAAILSKGYGGGYKKKVLEVTDGNDINAGPAEAGDEPYLLAKRLERVPVIVSKRRHLAGLYAHKKHGTNFFILDDGFQHVALYRDLDLVLIDGSNPFGNGHLLPWGPLREPKRGLKRSDAFIITRSGHDGAANELMDELKKDFPGKPTFRSDHTPQQIVFPSKSLTHNSDLINGRRVTAFAGIARPEVFMGTLAELGAEVVSFRRFEDHHPFNHREIQDLMNEKRRLKADYLLTTEKDWVRMEGLIPRYPELASMTIKFSLLDEGERFFRMMKEKAKGLRNSECGMSK